MEINKKPQFKLVFMKGHVQ